MTFVKLSQIETQYVVYNTGYTSRLVEDNEFIWYSLEELIDIHSGNSSLRKLEQVDDQEYEEHEADTQVINRFLKSERHQNITKFFTENTKFETRKIEEDDELNDIMSEYDYTDFRRAKPVFIFDALWGRGFYLHKSVDPKDHVSNIFQVHAMMISSGNSCGYIVFINNTMGFDYVKWLINQDFCCLYGTMNHQASIMMDSETKFGITIIDIDSESG